MNKEIIWLCGPEKYKKSGIGNYSIFYLKKLKESFAIKQIWFNEQPRSFRRIILQYVISPIKLIFQPNTLKVFYDEGWLSVLFYPLRNCIFVVHDIRDFKLTLKNGSFLENLFFKSITASFHKLNSSKVKKVIVPTEFTKEKLIKFGIKEEKIEVIYNPIDENMFNSTSIDKNLLKKKLFRKFNISSEHINKKIIYNMGSEEERKNFITILKAYKILDPQEYFLIKVGKPIILKNRESNKDFIEKNNLEVALIEENVNDDDFASFYHIADIFVFPSLYEGFGRPPAEAQACGCPVISSSNSGLKEVIQDSALIIDNPLDAEEIATKIKKITNDIELAKKLIEKGYVNAKRFNLKNNLPKWEKVLN